MPPEQTISPPSASDPLVRGATTVIGGPPGRHTRFGAANFWTPLRVLIALSMLTFTAGFLLKLPCSGHPWEDHYQYTRLCYSDVYALFHAEGLDERKVPYRDHPVEYPAVIGGLMWAAGSVSDDAADFFAVTSVMMLVGAVVATVLTARAAGRRRPWDAALVALAPGILLHGTTNWDLAAVALLAAAVYAWSRRQPEVAGIWLGLGIATKLYPGFMLVALALLCFRARRMVEFWRCAGVAVGTLLLVYLPLLMFSGTFEFEGCEGPVRQAAWRKFITLNECRVADWDSMAFAWQQIRNTTIDVPTLNRITEILVAAVVLLVALLVLRAPRRPRLAQVLFLLVAGFLLVNKVNSPQYTVWLVPLAALARPRWGAFLAWQSAELLVMFTRFYYFIKIGDPPHGIDVQWFLAAVLLRNALLLVLVVLVVNEVLHPYLDVVRRDGEDDPAGGVLDGAMDRGERARSTSGAAAPAVAG
jgi:uncharacterized membrane protein